MKSAIHFFVLFLTSTLIAEEPLVPVYDKNGDLSQPVERFLARLEKTPKEKVTRNDHWIMKGLVSMEEMLSLKEEMITSTVAKYKAYLAIAYAEHIPGANLRDVVFKTEQGQEFRKLIFPTEKGLFVITWIYSTKDNNRVSTKPQGCRVEALPRDWMIFMPPPKFMTPGIDGSRHVVVQTRESGVMYVFNMDDPFQVIVTQ